MFRGGRVDSRGTGITSGLADGGRVGMFEGGISTSMMEELTGGSNTRRSTGGRSIYNRPIGPPRGGLSGGNIFNRALAKARNIPYVGRFAVPIFGSAAGAYGTAAGIGTGIGALTDFYAKSTYTPEGYKRLKEVSSIPFSMDETNIDVGEDLDYIAEGNKIGEAPGFFPRGGKEKFFKDKGLDPNTGLPIEDKEEEKEIVKKVPTDTPEIEVKDSNTEESLDVGADLKKTQKLFEELLGMDKARRRDVGDMLGRASAAFLGAPSVREGLADFMRTESATGPGRGEKIGQTAAALAINDYIAGKKSKADLEKLLAAEKFRTDYKIKAVKEGLSFDDKLLNAADKEGKSKKSISIIQSVVDDIFGEGVFKGPLPKDVNQLEIGAVYVGDNEDKSAKIVYQINEDKVPVPIKTIY